VPSNAEDRGLTTRQAELASLNLVAGKTLESTGTHYSPAHWRDEEGGYVGHANWRDQYRMGTTSVCGHRHRAESVAKECIDAIIREASSAI
jgi:hypothetical protein